MNETEPIWEKWLCPYDPRRVDGADVLEDEFGRMIEKAMCGIRCPGCGICCRGYRDPIREDYQGVEEYDPNLKAIGARGGMVRLGENWLYKGADCGENCPGYGQCCKPLDQSAWPRSVEAARNILLERDDAVLREIEEALMFLAHDGSDAAVKILEAYQPKAHTRVAFYAQLALEEGQFFNEEPETELEQEHRVKREVRQEYEDRIIHAEVEIDETFLPRLQHMKYELEVTRRIQAKASGDEEEKDWQDQIDVLEALIMKESGDLEDLRADIRRWEAMVAEIEAEIGPDPLPENPF